MKKYLLTTKIAALLLAVSLLLGITLILPSCQITFPFFTPDNVITEEQYSTLAEQLSANVDAGCDKQYANVTSYLVYWDFPAFDKIKVRSIENTYSTYLINDPGYSDPDKLLALATSVANYYIDNILTKDGEVVFSLEEIQNKDLQTDAILTAYAASVGAQCIREDLISHQHTPVRVLTEPLHAGKDPLPKGLPLVGPTGGFPFTDGKHRI